MQRECHALVSLEEGHTYYVSKGENFCRCDEGEQEKRAERRRVTHHFKGFMNDLSHLSFDGHVDESALCFSPR
jgi:hypothetical protein